MDYKVQNLKSYKGFGIDKFIPVDEDGNRLKKHSVVYNVSLDDDYIGDEFDSIEDAKAFIDKII